MGFLFCGLSSNYVKITIGSQVENLQCYGGNVHKWEVCVFLSTVYRISALPHQHCCVQNHGGTEFTPTILLCTNVMPPPSTLQNKYPLKMMAARSVIWWTLIIRSVSLHLLIASTFCFLFCFTVPGLVLPESDCRAIFMFTDNSQWLIFFEFEGQSLFLVLFVLPVQIVWPAKESQLIQLGLSYT